MAFLATALGEAIFGSKAFGSKPEVPTLRVADPNAVQAETIAGNTQALPAAQQLGSQINSYNIQEQLGMLSKALEFVAPGQLQKAQGIVSSQLNGEVPRDVMAQVRRRAAAQSMMGGYGGGSGIGRNLGLRDFGLTSMNIQQQGLSNFGALASLAPKPQPFDVSSMFFTPQQRLDYAFKMNESQFNRDWMQSQVDAAPDPFASAMTQALIHDENEILKTVSSVAGMAGGACWIARRVLGTADNRWRLVRIWLFTEAPAWFRNFYLAHGARIAREMDDVAAASLYTTFDGIANHVLTTYARTR